MRRPRLSDQRGFSLPELMIAMFVGTIVLLAAFMVLDRSFTASGQIADRSDALQRGRLAMDRITRQLRSQVCVGTAKDPMVSGTDTSVTFFADLSDGTKPVQQRTLAFDSGTDTITESVINGAGTYPDLTFTTVPKTVPLLTKTRQVMDGATARPIFRYFGYKVGGTPGELELLAAPGAPLSAANLSRVAVIRVGFRAFADRSLVNDADSVVLEDDVYVRAAVSTNFQDGPECF